MTTLNTAVLTSDPGAFSFSIWAVVVIIAIVASLISHRIPTRTVLRNIAAWAIIGAIVYTAVLFRAELAVVWDRARADFGGGPAPTVSGGTTQIAMQPDGHFWVDATVGTATIRCLIDSGATTTTISASSAEALGLTVDRSGHPLVVMTANGPVNVWPAQIPSITVGNVTVAPLSVLVSDVAGAENLLGMNWLSRLKSWQVDDRVMTVRP